jgi:hypothetical protein
MCRANGKRWTKYRESDRANEYLEALSTEARISVHALIESRAGGVDGGETWIHPRVAVDLARWISAPFAVWMDGWFLESLQQARPAPVESPPPRLREVEVIALVERSITLFEQLGGLDQRDQLLFKDIVRSNVLTASSGLLLGAPTDQERCRATSSVLPASSWPGPTAKSSGKSPLAGNSSLTVPRVRSRATDAPG